MNATVKNAIGCPNCGRPLPAGTLAGLCPACLLAQGGETEAGGPAIGARFQSLPVEEVVKLFPQLEILGLLGTGGMGAVYKARQPALDRIVALKILPADGAGGVKFEERFNREARALARLSHPNIVAVHEFGQVGGLHYFLMEFVDGANLRQLEKAGRLAPREALQLIPQICDALQYAHDEGVVHRDIKPENVLVDRKGRVKIADFGLAKILGHDPESLRLTAEGQVMGTPHYMAPEQVERPLTVDHRADIYSLGVVLYEMLTGDLPLGKFSPPSRKVQVDVRFDEVVLRALENDPARRYQQASEVKSRVETIAGTPAPAPTTGTEGAPARPEKHYRHWAGIPVVVVRDGEAEVSWNGLLNAVILVLGVLFLAFMLVWGITGHALAGGKTLPLSLLAAAWVIIFGVRRVIQQEDAPAGLPRTRQGTAILAPRRWRPRREHFALALILVLVVGLGLFEVRRLRQIGSIPSQGSAEQVATLGGQGLIPPAPAPAELWSPTTGPGEAPDPNKIQEEAKELMDRGAYEESLQRHIWYHNHAAEIQPSLSAVRRSFGLSAWLELSRRYPRARQALLETRDNKARELAEGRGYAELFADVASINYYLQADDATSSLFKRIHEIDPTLARQCIHYAKEALVKSREYQLFLDYIPSLEAEFGRIRRSWNEARAQAGSQKETQPSRQLADERFVKEVRQLIEILAGAGRKADAERIRAQAAALVDDPQLQTAGTDAAGKIGE